MPTLPPDADQQTNDSATRDFASPQTAPADDGSNVFKGRFGLRAVWACLLYIVLFFVAVFATHVAVRLAEHKSALPSRTDTSSMVPHDLVARVQLPSEAASFLAVLLASWALSRVERRRLRVYGLGRNRALDFFPGAFWGFALLSGLVFTLRAAHVLVFDGRSPLGPGVYISGIIWLLAFFFVGLFEEYFTRGFLQYTLTRGLYTMAERRSPKHARAIAFWSAAIIMSCVFGVGHLANPGETAPGIVAVFVAGIVFSYALWHTGSLWWAVGFHMAWDWAQSFFYGVPDSGFLSAGRLFQTHPTGSRWLSGGPTGPEGSLFVLPTLLLVVLIVRFTTRPAAEQPALYPETPAPAHALPAARL